MFHLPSYPLILSIENHCNVQQQKVMAQVFKEELGSLLLTQPVDPNATMLPSPEALKNKIIIKHKKLPSGSEELKFTVSTDDCQEEDLSNSLHNGYLRMEDKLDHVWRCHYFVLTSTKLFYSGAQEIEEEPEEDTKDLDEVAQSFKEPWYHGKMANGRVEADQLLKDTSDGSFLVRVSNSGNKSADGKQAVSYSLSFARHGKVNHVRIHTCEDAGKEKFYMQENMLFDSLYALVEHYRAYPLKSSAFSIKLGDPCSSPNRQQSYENQPWFHKSMSRETAENMLKQVHYDGAFLVRESETQQDAFAITFRADDVLKHCRITLEEGNVFTIGSARFEKGLVELVNYYQKNPLYKKMRLRYPINEEVLKKLDHSPSAHLGASTGAILTEPNKPSESTIPISVQAKYEYKANKDDELSFCEYAIITNVRKFEDGWWKGDYNGQVNLWFPANHVEEIEPQKKKDERPLGTLQKDSFDITGMTVEIVKKNPKSPASTQGYRFIIVPRDPMKHIEVATETFEEVEEWIRKITQAKDDLAKRTTETLQQERTLRIAVELSDLIVYCRSVRFNEEKIHGMYYEMSSFAEGKAEKYMSKKFAAKFVKYNFLQLSRIYPKGARVDSSNYDPSLMWNFGSQLVALNYQTPDRPMQLNEGRFWINGRCGYVLQPECMRYNKNYDPLDINTWRDSVNPIVLEIAILSARNLVKQGRGIPSPHVEVDCIGLDIDSHNKYRTATKSEVGLNPSWGEVFTWDIANPDVALIRFVVNFIDVFSEPNFLCQSTLPIRSLRNGFRSIRLKNGYSEELELSTLLVHITIRNVNAEEEEAYGTMLDMKAEEMDIRRELNNAIQTKDNDKVQTLNKRLEDSKGQWRKFQTQMSGNPQVPASRPRRT
eukprot:scpid29980/ scgid3392/ 1-phosphatidylinositol 4,5-bisphosphate phosphodiesterase gamma-1; Phosphoinositide phospholipase C-gamma-1; Phospholipase C-gamma-1